MGERGKGEGFPCFSIVPLSLSLSFIYRRSFFAGKFVIQQHSSECNYPRFLSANSFYFEYPGFFFAMPNPVPPVEKEKLQKFNTYTPFLGRVQSLGTCPPPLHDPRHRLFWCGDIGGLGGFRSFFFGRGFSALLNESLT